MEEQEKTERQKAAEEGTATAESGAGRKRRKKWILLAGIVLALGVLAGTGCGVFHHYFRLLGRLDPPVSLSLDSPGVLPEENEEEPSAPPATEYEIQALERELQANLKQMETDSGLYRTDAFHLLLIGVDARDDSTSGRSDCMILVSINKKTKQVTMTSFLRDIYCAIPGHGSTRLNHAYAYGGTELLKDTIKANFGISVDRCLVVNFYFVMDLVDAIGGIDLDLTADEIGVMNRYLNAQSRLLGRPDGADLLSEERAGTIHVNGNQALAYARVRYIGTDFARTGRQRTVIARCLDRIKTMRLGEIGALAEDLLPEVRTDLTEGDCAALLLMALDLKSYRLRSLTIPVDGSWNNANIRGMSVLTVSFAENARAWHALVDEGGAE